MDDTHVLHVTSTTVTHGTYETHILLAQDEARTRKVEATETEKPCLVCQSKRSFKSALEHVTVGAHTGVVVTIE